ncbi:hypothetical protein KIW84_030908 [Lathyrus oleraceus]|uniref:Uncharacterized protein n=1 Tax=Pisum sativum TaxID=3888 RepID=A0A9D4XQK8_PEA|nr:hypothetical protein KIW84_030908 [Pisum sativum]
MPYAALFKKLMDLGMVQPRMLAPVRSDQRPPNYNENARCEFHSGAPGHNIEGCRAFKHTVQDLVESKALHFSLLSDVNANPMSAHGQVMVNAIAEDSDHAYTVGEETDSDCELESWIKSLSKQEEKAIQPHVKRVEIVIPSTAEVRKEIGKLGPLQRRVESRTVVLLKGHVDTFAWSCQDMPGSSTNVVVHKLPWKEDRPLKKQNASACIREPW